MVHAALDLARAHHVPDLVTGTLVLAALTSLPNAYAAVHLARLGRGAALMSEAMNSNTLNLLGGIALPAAIFGLGGRPAGGPAFGWMAGLTILALGLALWRKGLGRGGALAILAGYGAFVGLVLAGRL
jgi:Ca2+/Na+ antiporter